MKKELLLLLFLVLVSGCVSYQQAQPASTPTTAAQAGQQLLITILVSNGSGFFSQNVSVANGSTALQAFEKVLVLEKKEYSGIGAYVSAVNGLKENAGEGKFWQYYVNGKLAPVAVDKFVLKKGYVLEWRYEAPNFDYGQIVE